ncbi:MAG: hypothetical protein NVSMB51_03930 [Solirubrobacteraceae bacterium]
MCDFEDPVSPAFSITLPRNVEASSRARAAVRDELGGRVPDATLDDVLLVVSELVTNALVHGQGMIELRVELDGQSVKGEVIDEGGGFEREMRVEGVQEVGGHGLAIVGQVAANWGVHEGTTHVWFELPLGGAPDALEEPQLGHPGAEQLPEV